MQKINDDLEKKYVAVVEEKEKKVENYRNRKLTGKRGIKRSYWLIREFPDIYKFLLSFFAKENQKVIRDDGFYNPWFKPSINYWIWDDNDQLSW